MPISVDRRKGLWPCHLLFISQRVPWLGMSHPQDELGDLVRVWLPDFSWKEKGGVGISCVLMFGTYKQEESLFWLWQTRVSFWFIEWSFGREWAGYMLFERTKFPTRRHRHPRSTREPNMSYRSVSVVKSSVLYTRT